VTVKELIEALQKMPQDAEIVTEGCDCYGDCAAVKYADNLGTLFSEPYYSKSIKHENKVYLLRS